MKIKIEKGLPSGVFNAPPSKSYAHRLLICSALSGEECTVSGIAPSEDILATLDSVKALGVAYAQSGDVVVFQKKGAPLGNEFKCRESGSTLRFFIPIALSRGGVFVFKGTERLISRGISVYEDICALCGISVEYTKDSIRFEGKLRSGTYEVRGDISSQFITGLLFALPMLDGDSVVKITTELESRPYIDITLDCLSRFGIEIMERADNEFYIKGNQKYISQDTIVEGDFSNSAFLDAFKILGAPVSVNGLNYASKQGDKAYLELFEQIKKGYLEADISSCPDLAPVLFALCAYCEGGYITGTRRLKIKESDRASAMAEELSKLGIRVDVYENAVKINKGELKAPCVPLSSHNDHRIAMALSVLATAVGAEIDGAEAVSKSYPDFFEVLRAHSVKCEELK